MSGSKARCSPAAFAAAAAGAVTGSAWLALGAGILAAVALALLHGYASITHRGNQVVSGVAINILASGLTDRAGHRLVPSGRPDAAAVARRALHADRSARAASAGLRADPRADL